MIPLRLQPLEGRDVPAGTVTATLSGTTWTLVGDDLANSITIGPDAEAGEFVLAGTDTTLVGVTAPEGVKNILVRMGDGDDSVTVTSGGPTLAIDGSLTVDGGDGANSLSVGGATIGKNLTVTNGTNGTALGDPADSTFIASSAVVGKITVRNGDGNSATSVRSFSFVNSSVGRGLSIRCGTGADSVLVADNHVGGNVMVDLGQPRDDGFPGTVAFANFQNSVIPSVITGGVSIKVGGGSNAAGNSRFAIGDYHVGGDVRIDDRSTGAFVRLDASFVQAPVVIGGSVTITTAGGVVGIGSGNPDGANIGTGIRIGKSLSVTCGDEASAVRVFGATVGGTTMIRTGNAADVVLIDDSSFRAFTLLTGGGTDTVSWELGDPEDTRLRSRFVGKLKVDLGAGGDTITLGVEGDIRSQVEFFGPATLLGGDGSDSAETENVLAPLGTPVSFVFEN